MPVSPARLAAFEMLLKIERQAAYSSELLHSDAVATLSPADRGLTTELVMGVLRWRSRLDADIARFSFTPFPKLDLEVLTALRLGVYQLEFLERVPARAAINESVEIVKHARKASAAPLTNAVLRKIPKTANAERAARHQANFPPQQAQPGSPANNDFGFAGVEPRRSLGTPVASSASEADAAGAQHLPAGGGCGPATDKAEEVLVLAARLSADFAHPRWLVERWLTYYGADAAAAICRYNQTVPATTIRLSSAADESRLSGSGVNNEAGWRAAGFELAPGTLLRSARRLVSGNTAVARSAAANPAEPGATCPAALAIQDEGSQLVAALVGRGSRILDCCAAPGAKTAALAERNPQSEIVAVDLHPHRARLMRRLLAAPDVRILVIAADARALPLAGGFDRVLADVPCSGTGTLARNPEIKWRLTPADLADLHARQVAILRAALAQLAPGGRLVYSTCSLEPEENEAVVAELLNQEANARLIDVRGPLRRLKGEGELLGDDPEALARGPYLRTIPGRQRCDGFFAAILERD